MKRSNQKGFVLIAVMLLTFFVITAGTVTAQLASSNLRAANIDTYRVNAQFAADAGIDASVYQVNDGRITGVEWFGTGGSEIEVANEATFKTTYESEVTNQTIDGVEKKLIVVTGRTYSPKTSPTPVSTRTYRVMLRPVQAGDFSVVTGVGGLVMENSSKVLGGSVFVNGSITMSNSAQIGLLNDPVDVFSAHMNCPAGGGPSYPTQCLPSDGEPISISNPAWIYGDVTAQNQTNGARMSNGGLQPGGVSPLALPVHNRDAQKAAINPVNNRTGADASCTTNGGTKVWQANTKITGNVVVRLSCTVTVLGDVWITGNVTMTQSGTIRPSNALVTPPVIMVDDTVTLTNSSSFASTSGATPIGFRVVSYKNSLNNPDAIPAGADLFNSSAIESISLTQTSSGPHTEFYSKWSKLSVGNSGGIGAVTGQTIRLHNSASITFGTKVGGVPTIVGWVIESYRRDYSPL